MKAVKIILLIPVAAILIMYVLYFSPLFKHHFPGSVEYPIVTMSPEMLKQINAQTSKVNPKISEKMDGWGNVSLTFPNGETKIGGLIFDKVKSKLVFVVKPTEKTEGEIYILK